MHSNSPHGIDASGDFDWAAWKGHVNFGMTLTTRGLSDLEPEFYHNWDSMSQLEVVRFAMHWFNPTQDPGEQAKHFVESVRPRTEYDGLVVYIQPIIGHDPVQASFAAYVFCQELTLLTGMQPIIFTTPTTAETGYCAKLGEYPLWIIDHDTPIPHIPPPWKKWDFWEYASDRIGLHLFNGKMRELDKL